MKYMASYFQCLLFNVHLYLLGFISAYVIITTIIFMYICHFAILAVAIVEQMVIPLREAPFNLSPPLFGHFPFFFFGGGV